MNDLFFVSTSGILTGIVAGLVILLGQWLYLLRKHYIARRSLLMMSSVLLKNVDKLEVLDVQDVNMIKLTVNKMLIFVESADVDAETHWWVNEINAELAEYCETFMDDPKEGNAQFFLVGLIKKIEGLQVGILKKNYLVYPYKKRPWEFEESWQEEVSGMSRDAKRAAMKKLKKNTRRGKIAMIKFWALYR